MNGHDEGALRDESFRDELRRRDRRFRSLIEKSSDLISIIGRDGRVSYQSPAIEPVLGYTIEERLGAAPGELVHEDDREMVRQEMARLYGDPTYVASVRVRLIHCNGSIRVFDLKGRNLLDDPAVEGIVVNARDITDRVQAEERLRHVAASSPAVLYSLAVDGDAFRPAWVSENVATVTGYSVDEALDPVWWAENLHPDDRDKALAASASVLDRERVSHEYRFRFADGIHRWIRDQMVAIRAPDGSVREIVGSLADTNEFHRLESQFHQSQKLEAVGRLAGGIAHDYNNILTAVSGNAQFLLDALPADSPLRTDAEEIIRNADRATELTRQLLAFSRKQIMTPRRLDLAALVRGMGPMLRRLLGEDLQLQIDADGPCMVEGDPNQLERVVLNLAVNARDAMPDGGIIQMSVRLETPSVAAAADFEIEPGDYIVLDVTDTGVGMDRGTANRIFEPFFTTKEAGRGTGLGLSIVYGIVKQSGGYIFVNSAPDRGTSVRAYLPQLGGEMTESEADEPAAPVEHGNGEVVLLVEDEDSVRVLARRILSKYGYEVVEARGPGEALLVAEQHDGPIHLLLTDVVMPTMNGPELADRLRLRMPDLPVLFMSGYTEDEMTRRRMREEPANFVQKPFLPPDLASAVHDAIQS